MSVRGDRIVE